MVGKATPLPEGMKNLRQDRSSSAAEQINQAIRYTCHLHVSSETLETPQHAGPTKFKFTWRRRRKKKKKKIIDRHPRVLSSLLPFTRFKYISILEARIDRILDRRFVLQESPVRISMEKSEKGEHWEARSMQKRGRCNVARTLV